MATKIKSILERIYRSHHIVLDFFSWASAQRLVLAAVRFATFTTILTDTRIPNGCRFASAKSNVRLQTVLGAWIAFLTVFAAQTNHLAFHILQQHRCIFSTLLAFICFHKTPLVCPTVCFSGGWGRNKKRSERFVLPHPSACKRCWTNCWTIEIVI